MQQGSVGMIAGGYAAALVGLLGVLIAAALFAWLQVLLVRGRLAALRALEEVRELAAALRSLQERIAGMESRLEQKLDARGAELEQKLSARTDEALAQARGLPPQGRPAEAESVGSLEVRLSRLEERAAALPARAPGPSPSAGPFERLEGLVRAAPGQPDLPRGALMAALDEMKAELQLGVSRVERLESMLRTRSEEEAGAVVGPSREAVPPEPLSEEEAEFEEWEQEAKELAASDEAEPEPDAVLTESTVEFLQEVGDYPAEIRETAPETPADDLDEGLFEDDDVELPEIDEEDGTEEA